MMVNISIYVYDIIFCVFLRIGFALVDFKFLHNESQVYLESSAHLLLIKTYLYSWLKSSLPISSYESQFIIHGTVGYLINYYLEEVFGMDEGKYWYQKVHDTVIELEKFGLGCAMSSFFPEKYELFNPCVGQYLVNKSIVVFKLIESRIGGKDQIRNAIKNIVKSPSLFVKKFPNNNSNVQRSTSNSPSNYSPSEYRSVTSGGMSPSSPYTMGTGNMSPYAGTAYMSAMGMGGIFVGNTSPLSPYVNAGNLSPYQNNDPMGGFHNFSPYHYAQSPFIQNPGYTGANNMQTAGLYRQMVSYNTGWDDRDSNVFSSNCLSCETFISAMKHTSGASVDIGEEFLTRFVYGEGVLFIRFDATMTQKVINTPRQILVSTEQIGYQCGGFIDQSYCEKEDVKIRIVEVRDDVVTEPSLSLSETKEVFQQQAFTRPGLRKGFKRKSKVNEEVLSPEELEEMERREKELDELKPALQWVRDVYDNPIRFVALDPLSLYIIEANNISADALLIEQLYAEQFESNIKYQCQALRSLARGSVLNVTSHNLSDSIKSEKIQLKALEDCLLGVNPLSTGNSDSNCISQQHSVYIRAEAAYALAKWQNLNAPKFSHDETPRDGLKVLIDCLQEMYYHPDKNSPLPSDFSNESATYLQNAIILAISSIKSKSGFTPPKVIDILLQLVDYRSDEELFTLYCPEEVDPSPLNRTVYIPEVSVNVVQYDDTYHKAILLQALSRVRYENLTNTNDSKSKHSINGVKEFAVSTIDNAYTTARTLARIKYKEVSKACEFPSLPGNGLDVASAITCLSELDIQTVLMNSKSIFGKSNHGNVSVSPTGIGIFTGFNYKKYFLPINTSLKCVHEPSSTVGSGLKNQSRDELIYFLSSPVVRIAAFEAFARLCFAQHTAHEIKHRHHASATNTAVKVPDSAFIAAAFEVFVAIQKNEPSPWVCEQCAIALMDAIQDRPPRVVAQHLCYDNNLLSMDRSDTLAYTYPLHCYKQENHEYYKQAMKSSGVYVRVAIKLFWKLIISTDSTYDQVNNNYYNNYYHSIY